MSVLTRMEFVRLLDNRLRDVAERVYSDLPDRIPTFYNVTSSNSAWEEFMDVGVYPDVPEFIGRLVYQHIYPGFHTRIEHKEFASGIHVERKLLDDKKYGVLDDRGAAMMEAAARTKQKWAAKLFNDSFSGTHTFATNEEGVALCSNSHLTRAANVSTTTSPTGGFDNLGTSALNKTNLAATYVNFQNLRNDIAELIDYPDTWQVIVPVNLEETAWEIIKTPKGLDTAYGNQNWQFGKYGLHSWFRLDTNDTNNWWMINTSFMKKFNMWFNRIAPEINTTVDFDHFLYKASIYMRFSFGWRDWRWVYGHNVS